MSAVKSINEIIWIYFAARTCQLKVDQCYPIFYWSWNFWELFSLISFLKNFSFMKRSWREELQLPLTIKHSFLSRIAINGKTCSNDIGSFDSFRSKFFAKVISCFKSFSQMNMICEFFKCFSHRNVWPLGQRAEIRERIAS